MTIFEKFCTGYILIFFIYVSAVASESGNLIKISGIKENYLEGSKVNYKIHNLSKNPVNVIVHVEKHENNKWRYISTLDKRIYVIKLNHGEVKDVNWKFSEDSYTFERFVTTGTYRHKLQIMSVNKEKTLEEIYTKEFTIKR
jgi:hypothetical protein